MAKKPDRDLIGKIWCERFEILDFIGRGGMGNVFKARQLQIDREIALKVIHRKLTTDEKQVKRFEREAQASSKLSHPNNIRVYDYGTGEDGRLFIAMEYLQGQTLADLIASEGPMPAKRVVHLTRQLLKALAEAHQLGLVHRDLKPENIFLCDVYGETDFVKVLDFGIAKSLTGDKEQADLTQTGFICGTPRYISPEQALGQPVDGRADLYAVAVLMYEMLTGRPPFLGENPISIVMKHVYDDAPPLTGMEKHGQLGAELKVLIEALLEKNPARRPESAEKVLSYFDGKITIETLTGGRVKTPSAPPPMPGSQLPSFDEATRGSGAPPPLPAGGPERTRMLSVDVVPGGDAPVEATRMMQQLGDLRSFVEDTDANEDPEQAEATQFLTADSPGFADFASVEEDEEGATKMMSAMDLEGDLASLRTRREPSKRRNTGLQRVPKTGRPRKHTELVGERALRDMTPPELAAPPRRGKGGAPTWALVASGVAISVILLSVIALLMTDSSTPTPDSQVKVDPAGSSEDKAKGEAEAKGSSEAETKAAEKKAEEEREAKAAKKTAATKKAAEKKAEEEKAAKAAKAAKEKEAAKLAAKAEAEKEAAAQAADPNKVNDPATAKVDSPDTPSVAAGGSDPAKPAPAGVAPATDAAGQAIAAAAGRVVGGQLALHEPPKAAKTVATTVPPKPAVKKKKKKKRPASSASKPKKKKKKKKKAGGGFGPF